MAGLFRRDKRTAADMWFDCLFVSLSALLFFIAAYPMYFVVIASFSTPQEVLTGKVWLWPRGFTLEGYKLVLEDPRIWNGYRNTVSYMLVGTLISLVGTLPAAYALSRKELPGRGAIIFFLTVTMFFSGGLVPTYLVISKLGLVNTFWVMVIPFAVSVYNVIIARTFFATTIPEELMDAARIDGCGYTRFFTTVVMPLSKAIIAVIGMYYAVWYWNEYFRALVYARGQNLVPLQMVLRDILIEQSERTATGAGTGYANRQMQSETMKYALILVSSLPIMLVYPFLQKYFTKGVMIGSIKG